MSRDFKNIKAWKSADDLAVLIFNITKAFPKDELYVLTAQLKRAALSVPTNIAEGASRNYNKEYLQFLYIAKGSLKEVEYLLYFANKLEYLAENQYLEVENLRIETAKILHGLITAVANET